MSLSRKKKGETFAEVDLTKNENRFVGVHLPQRVNSYITLYALTTQSNKSMLIREQMVGWMEEAIKKHPIDNLLQKAIKHYQKEWDVRKAIYRYSWEKEEIAFDMFKVDLDRRLMTKGVDRVYVDYIIGELINAKETT
jgi:hypothetical protein